MIDLKQILENKFLIKKNIVNNDNKEDKRDIAKGYTYHKIFIWAISAVNLWKKQGNETINKILDSLETAIDIINPQKTTNMTFNYNVNVTNSIQFKCKDSNGKVLGVLEYVFKDNIFILEVSKSKIKHYTEMSKYL